jgi:hypothetical protein
VIRPFRGSSWPVLVETDAERVVVKLRGTAQGLLPLVAELVVGALADTLGLATPGRSLVRIDAGLTSDDPHEELLDLLARSAGLNLGLSWLEGFRDVTPGDAQRIAPELAARIVWLDAFVENPDRTAHNTNLMIKAGNIQLIDHGAALGFHHDWTRVTEQAPRDAGQFVAEHLFHVSEPQLALADTELAPQISRDTLQQALAQVPDDFLAPQGPDLERTRESYVAYLWKRLRAPRPWVAPGKNVPFQLGR